MALTNSEYEIMEVLWTENRAMTKNEIIEKSPNRSWKKASIHTFLNSLIKKGIIARAGEVTDRNIVSRKYAPVISQEELLSFQIKLNNATVIQFVSWYLKRTKDKQLWEELSNIISRTL